MEAPLSPGAEADLQRLARKWATLIAEAASFEQPLRFMLEFVGRYGGIEKEVFRKGEDVKPEFDS